MHPVQIRLSRYDLSLCAKSILGTFSYDVSSLYADQPGQSGDSNLIRNAFNPTPILPLREQLLDHLAAGLRELLEPAAVEVGQLVVVQPQDVQQRHV